MTRKIPTPNERALTGVEVRNDTGNVFKVPLSDHRIIKAGIDPKTLLGKGITEGELQRRLRSKK